MAGSTSQLLLQEGIWFFEGNSITRASDDLQIKELDNSYHKAVQTHESISLKYLKRDSGKISVDQLDLEWMESKKDLTRATANYIDKINQINVGGEIDLMVAYCNAVSSMENSWRAALIHADFFANFSKDFGDYIIKVSSLLWC